MSEWKLVPVEPTETLLRSMAARYTHDFGLLGPNQQQMLMTMMRQIHEEVVGTGFYRAPSPESVKHDEAAAALRELEAENRMYSDALANYEQHDHEVKEENVALHARVAELKAESVRLSVLDGTSCREEQEAGNGPCGCCVICLRARVAGLEAENRMYSESLANATQEIERLRGRITPLAQLSAYECPFCEEDDKRLPVGAEHNCAEVPAARAELEGEG